MKRMISVLVSNHPGVLMRVAGLISRRGYNICTLAVGETEDPHYSRISIVLQADDAITKQVVKQISKLIEVISAEELPLEEATIAGIALIKVRNVRQWELYELTELFGVKVMNFTAEAVTFEITGDEGRICSFIDQLRPYGILEMARTGMLGLQRGGAVLRERKRNCYYQTVYCQGNKRFADAVGEI